MAKFEDILIKNKIISAEQLAEAEALARRTGESVGDALVKLGYVSAELVMKALAPDREARFSSADEMRKGLSDIIAHIAPRAGAASAVAAGR